MLHQLVFTVLLSAVCLAQENQDGCDESYLKWTNMIHDEHCPELAKMEHVNTTLYPACLEKGGYPFYNSIEMCFPKFKLPASRDPVDALHACCNPSKMEEGRRIVCCIVTQELKTATDKSPEDKYKISEKCITEFKNAYHIM